MWGSKTTKTSMGPDLDGFSVSHKGLDKLTCHPDMSELHVDISSAAAKIFAASVALSELLHLGYVMSELGLSYPQPVLLEVDNATAIMFPKDQVCGTLNFATSIVGRLGWRLYVTGTLPSLLRSA